MARLVLHIGTHKTGTTMIQNCLHAARRDLAARGVIYPDAGRHTGHHGLLTDWIALPPAYRGPGGGRAGLNALAGRWRDSEATLLLSSEEFSRAGGRGGHVDFAELRAIFGGFDIRVICALRYPWQFLQSVYLEIAQTRPPPPPAALIRSALETGQVDGLWCDYLALYDSLCQHFHPGEIRLIDYGAASRTEDGLLREVLRLAAPGLARHPGPDMIAGRDPGAITEDGPAPRPACRRDNPSPPPLPVWAAHVVAGGPSPGPDILAAASEAYDLEYGPARPGCLFTRSEIASLAAHLTPRNDRLANRVRGVQPGWSLSQADPPPGTLHREDIGPEYWIRLARRLALRRARAAA